MKLNKVKCNEARYACTLLKTTQYIKQQCQLQSLCSTCCCSVAWLCSTRQTSWTASHQASLFITISQNLLRLMSIKSVIPSSHLILCHSLLLLPSIFPSIRVFSSESVLHIRWPKYWSFTFSLSPFNEHSGLISFMIDWFDLLTVQRTLKSLLQPQFKNISSLVFSFLYSPTLTSIHDYRKNRNFDQMDLCQQSNVSAF